MSEVKQESGEIKVADISIAHLSRGLYRSTAAAFKELVNNAWDADAEEVRIYTNFPEFDFISCADNGPGMPEEKFFDYFANKGIGFGYKRKGHMNVTNKFKRPIIGRLGVGMLAIGQLCYSFWIESHYKDKSGGKAYKAEIDLLDITVPDIDESISSDKLDEQVKVGNWKLTRIPYDESKQGFRMYTSDVRDTFRREMLESIGQEDKDTMSFNLKKLHQTYFDCVERSIREMGAYLETVWELCILCPVPYMDGETYPFDVSAFYKRNKDSEYEAAINLIKEKQTALGKYNFKVIFDGIEIKRYLTLPVERDTIPRLFFLDFDEKVAGRRLKYSGYIFGQTKAIRPYELTGIQIRIRNVGIGGYDSTFFKYDKKIETIRNRWVSGEIFVEDGLEVALNIDRDSFNEHDEHFKVIQENLHNKLNTVFREIEYTANEQRKDRHGRKEETIKKETWAALEKSSMGKLRFNEADLGSDEPLLKYDKQSEVVTVNTSIRPVKRRKIDNLVRLIILAYYISKRVSENENERYNNFYNTIIEILKKTA